MEQAPEHFFGKKLDKWLLWIVPILLLIILGLYFYSHNGIYIKLMLYSFGFLILAILINSLRIGYTFLGSEGGDFLVKNNSIAGVVALITEVILILVFFWLPSFF